MAAAVLVLAALGVGLWLRRAGSESATAVLARAEQAPHDPVSQGVHSYAGRMVGRQRADATQPFAEWEQQIWFQAPDRAAERPRQSLVYDHSPAQPAPSGTPLTGPANPRGAFVLYVSDGSTAWLYDAVLVQAERVTPYTVGGPPFGTPDPQTLFKRLTGAFDARLAGTQTVAGREADVLVLTRKPGGAPGSAAQATVWIDRETGLPLRLERRAGQGAVLVAWAFTTFAVNPAVIADLFRFTPPDGAVVHDSRARPTPTPEALP